MHASLKTDHPPFRGMENFVSRLATTINKFFPEKRPDQKEFFTLVAREADLVEFDLFEREIFEKNTLEAHILTSIPRSKEN